MSFSKIAQIALVVVVVISVIVIGFFYLADNMVDAEALKAKNEKLEAPAEGGFNFQQDMEVTEAPDSLIAEGDSTNLAVQSTVPTDDSDAGIMEEAAETVEFTFMEKLVNKKYDIAIGWAYILVLLTLIIVLGFSVIEMFSNTKTLVRSLIILAGVAILVGIAYMLGSGESMDIFGYEGTDNENPKVLRLVDTGLITTYFVLGMLVLSIFYSEIAKYFK